MRLIAFGCSHTYGSGITSEDINSKTPSRASWAAQLSGMLGAELVNYARPGAGNNDIVKKIISYKPKKHDIIVVGWTYLTRYTIYRKKENELDILPSYNSRKLQDIQYMKMFYKLFDDYNLSLINTMTIDHGYKILSSLSVPYACRFVNISDLNNVNEYLSNSINDLNLCNHFLNDSKKPNYVEIGQQIKKNFYGNDGVHFSINVHKLIAEEYYKELTSKV